MLFFTEQWGEWSSQIHLYIVYGKIGDLRTFSHISAFKTKEYLIRAIEKSAKGGVPFYYVRSFIQALVSSVSDLSFLFSLLKLVKLFSLCDIHSIKAICTKIVDWFICCWCSTCKIKENGGVKCNNVISDSLSKHLSKSSRQCFKSKQDTQ